MHIKQYADRIKVIGPKESLFGALNLLINTVLYSIHSFDRWHIRAVYQFRPYKSQVVEIANSTQPDTAIEIGCGLGDILSRIHAKNKLGIDIDSGAIRSAKFLHRQNIIFKQGSLDKARDIAKCNGIKNADLLI
ncbi:MAG TPA: class I SAM-dependent methyltransferase, partial [Methanosarcina sp.]|nr:class I SAM-dependent methyltransferase [Methanosarcina sp.]